MELTLEFIKILLPAGCVLIAMYLTVKAFLNKEFEKKLLDIKQTSAKTTLPVRLQAHERLCLLMERISPQNLVVRVNDPAYNAAAFRERLLLEVREEFTHNMSQQLYVSDQAWQAVVTAKETVQSIITQAGSGVDPEAKAIELAKKIFDHLMSESGDPVAPALAILKSDIRKMF